MGVSNGLKSLILPIRGLPLRCIDICNNKGSEKSLLNLFQANFGFMDLGPKRAKNGALTQRRIHNSSRILRPFRTVGIVSNGVPCAVSNLGLNYVVSTAVGRSIQIYDAASLRLMFITQPQTNDEIECIQQHYHYAFAVAGTDLLVYRRGQLEAKAKIPEKSSRIKALKIVIFGGYICVAKPDGVSVFKWSQTAKMLTFYAELSTSRVLGQIVDIAHMPTYINKLVVATSSCLVLFNVKSGKMIYTFNEVFQGISRVESVPTAIDIVAIVGNNGDIILTNIRTDRQLFTLATGEPITTLSFRSDSGSGSAALLGIGTANGDVFFYDLELRRRVQSLRSFAHSCQISSVQFIPGQPIVIVNGADNALTELVFDPPVASSGSSKNFGGHRARILRRRGGHGSPSSCLLFADEEAHFLLSGSLDQSLWAFSLRKDSQSHAFGGTQKINLPPITEMAYSAEKQDRWDTLLTAHKSSKEARTWSLKRGALGSHSFFTGDDSICKSVAVSHCGNFAVLGSAKGGLVVYNLQSGFQKMKLDAVHKSAISGVAMLPNNSALISASLDGIVKFLDFGESNIANNSKAKCLASLDLGLGAITKMRFHPGSGLLAVATDGMAIAVIDTATHKVVRELWGHGNRITSLDFAPSGRWILSSSLDSTIRTWDIPTGACIHGVKISNPATNLRVSANGEWVATSHVSGVGIQMWALRTVVEGLSFRNVGDEDLIDIEMPTVSGENGVSVLEGSLGLESEQDVQVGAKDDTVDIFMTPEVGMSAQLAPGLVTLSGEPSNKFTTLIHLDAIRERNKPKEGLEKPEKAPFFLGLTNEETKNEEPQSRLTSVPEAKSREQAQSLTHFLSIGDLGGIADFLAKLGPAATDLEIRSLNTASPYSEVIAFLDAMAAQALHGLRFELVQAWMAIFLRTHGDLFFEGGDEHLQKSFRSWIEAQKQCVARVQEHTRFCSGVISYLKQL